MKDSKVNNQQYTYRGIKYTNDDVKSSNKNSKSKRVYRGVEYV